MGHVRSDTQRRCLKVTAWPVKDRELYEQAIIDDPFSDLVAAAKWRPATRHKNERGYGRWLTFLVRRGEDVTRPAAVRVTQANVDAFVRELQVQGVKPGTLRNRLFELLAVISSIAPEVDWSWLRSRANSQSRRAKVASARVRFLEVAIVVAACERALSGAPRPHPLKLVPGYRNWLILYFLAYVPVRLGNLASLELDRHLARRNGEWLVTLQPEETKNGREYSAPVPRPLALHLERYLADVRPAVANTNSGQRLWLGISGRPLADHTIHIALRELTEREFGSARGPHSLRHSFATFAAETVGIDGARAGMGHTSSRRTQGYNHASTLAASVSHAELIAGLRTSSPGRRKRRS
ncbi:site-specific integrase [Bosea vestrisii]|uniref:tyrosine-type recombinase/integrase n=1 Tax=Bosea vestrisii TaxID=151416 RepID=UPI0024DF86D5|nr:site-specific integrase [Bosea vestrisii]WID94866.1 site-specific integrase [Bosea vestrisii]